MDRKGKTISPKKFTIIAFTHRRTLEELEPLNLRCENVVQLKGDVKYLGVTIDSKLTWTQYLKSENITGEDKTLF